ncbi:TlpA disulfide reductase family protein [Rhizosphaericola mali]|uniref:AhpC/TSA family protein n=1 Tax=Rhizosphaericola mali TaxID=2545455 RepID=A0A5P2FZL5_9BACT|nr:TlpA disulfide reductase family protein [Rhizosphaericola mali]QES87848.1 AhpC/TSA family protein [Rhizosphaericola mali]
MKSILITIVSIAFIGNYSIAQKKQNNVLVSGSVTNGKISYLIFNRYTVDNVFADTIKVKNNLFSYRQSVDEPQWTNVEIPEIKQQGLDDFSFFMEKGTISIELNANSIGKSFAKGTLNNDLRTAYLNKNKILLDSISDYTLQYLNIEDHTSADDAAQDSLMYLNDRLDKLGTVKMLLDSEYVTKYSDTYFALSLLKDELKNGIAIETAQPLFDNLDNSLSKTMLWAEVNKTITHLLQYKIENKVTDLNALDSSNTAVNLQNFYKKNSYTLIDLWASWCIPCQQEFPYLRNAFAKYKNQGFNIYGLSIDFTKDAWMNALNRLKLPWLNVNQGQNLPDFYMVSGIPFNVLVDSNGRIVARDLRGEKLSETLTRLYNK